MIGTAHAADGVNAVLGDASYVARFGVVPDATVDEDVRLRVHLEFVLGTLRANTPALTDAQRTERAKNLARLAAYIERGEFPRNRSFAGRRPHFIDETGRICAVGYLIEQSAGRAVAEEINAKHEWDFIPDIHGIEAWVDASGLTVTELAMIQPGYGRPMPHPRPPPPPPPPPVDEGVRQQQLAMNALTSVTNDVRGCAERFFTRGETISVTVTLVRFGALVSVEGRESRRLARCVQRTVENAVAGLGFRRRTQSLAVRHVFVLWQQDEQDLWIDRGNDDGFAKPPPR